MQYIGSQFYYGTGNDAKGFPGLLAQCKGDAAHTVDAGGAGNKTSVWFLRLGRECLEFLFGNNQTIRLQDTWDLETKVPPISWTRRAQSPKRELQPCHELIASMTAASVRKP